MKKKDKHTEDIAQKVMIEIEKQNLKMLPKVYFVLGSVAAGIGLAGSVLGLSLLVHLILFRLRVHRPILLLIEREHGLSPLGHFPWLSFVSFLFLCFVGLSLVREFDFGYKKSLWIILTTGLLFVLSVGFFIDRLGVENRLKRVPPPMHNVLYGQRTPPPHLLLRNMR